MSIIPRLIQPYARWITYYVVSEFVKDGRAGVRVTVLVRPDTARSIRAEIRRSIRECVSVEDVDSMLADLGAKPSLLTPALKVSVLNDRRFEVKHETSAQR